MAEFRVDPTRAGWDRVPRVTHVDEYRAAWLVGEDNLILFYEYTAKSIADFTGCEVRWNLDGSLQGHYVRPGGRIG